MPLHLLGKKSWNVYNADNIARVRRDEAAAKDAEEAEEQRMQEIDAQRRLAILRGEAPPPIEDVEPAKTHESPAGKTPGASHSGGMRRKRKRPDEDDTQFELRIAREKNELAVTAFEPERKATSTAPIVDHAGHIDLLGDAKLRAHAEKNEEAEREAKKKKQSFEDQYTMRFSNAAGRDGISNPWYSQSEPTAQEAPLKNVWGREDPQRRERDTKRIVASDPLAMMKQGASKVRELKKERKQFQEEQAGQLKQLRREERQREKRRRGHEESIAQGRRGIMTRTDMTEMSRRIGERKDMGTMMTGMNQETIRAEKGEGKVTSGTEDGTPVHPRETTAGDIGDTDLEIEVGDTDLEIEVGDAGPEIEAVNSLSDTPKLKFKSMKIDHGIETSKVLPWCVPRPSSSAGA